MKTKIRVQIDLSKKLISKLDSIKENSGASSRTEVIRKALSIYGDIIEQTNRGSKFGFLESNGSLNWYIIPVE